MSRRERLISDQPSETRRATDDNEAAAARAANRFDVRGITGGVFVVYAMLVFAACMIAWALLRPVVPEPAR